MKKQLNVLQMIALILFLQEPLFSQKIYLSPSGNDNNPGTIDKPFATLTAARNKSRDYRKSSSADQPIEIIALDGDYFMDRPLELTIEDSGSPASPLLFRPENPKKAIFNGARLIKGFEKVNDKLWRAFIPEVAYHKWYFEQLYVNDSRAIRARTPDEGFYFVRSVAETVGEKGTGRSPEVAIQKILLDSTEAAFFKKFGDQEFSDAVITFYHNWDNTRKHILRFNKEQSAIYTAGEGMKSWNPINNKSRWYADNFMGALNAPGEWFLERSGYLYYIPREGEKIENLTVFAPLVDNFVIIKGDEVSGKRVENIRFENITFKTSGYIMPYEGNEAAQAAAPVDASIRLDFASNIFFNNCEVAHTGTYAFWFRRACTNCSVLQSYLHDLGAGGIKIGETVIRPLADQITNNITVDNNIIRDGGKVFPCAVGVIIFNASDNKITHNEIADLRYTGISAGWVWGYTYSPSKRNTIEFNHIHHLGWGELCDMGGVYTLGASEGTTVSNNIIHHVYSFDYGGWGLYTDEGSFGIVEENNLVYACKNSGFHQHYGKENIIRNNIFAFNIRSQLQATRIEEHRSVSFTNNIIYFDKGTLMSSNWHKFNFFSENNCYWDTRTPDVKFADKTFPEWKKAGKDANSIIADPLFVDPSAFDFHFKKLTVAKKIKFVPFDYSRAGVYGDEEWKKLAEFDQALARKFDGRVTSLETKKVSNSK